MIDSQLGVTRLAHGYNHLTFNKRGWNNCNLMVAISRACCNGSYTMAAKPIKSLELHYTMIQFLVNIVICFSWSDKLFLFFAVSCHASGIYFLDFVRRIAVQVASARSREHLVQYRRACCNGSRHFRLQHGVRILCTQSASVWNIRNEQSVFLISTLVFKSLCRVSCG